MNLGETYYICHLHPQDNGESYFQLVAKATVLNDKVHLLESHHPMFDKLDGMDGHDFLEHLKKINKTSRFAAVSDKDIHEGFHPELLPNLEPQRDEVQQFLYQDAQQKDAQILSFDGQRWFLDGHELELDEVQKLMDNVKNKQAALSQMNSIRKNMTNDISVAISNLYQAVKAGQFSEQDYKAITSQVYKDSMTGLGNRKSYEDFLSRPRKGFHLRLDGVLFGQINKQFGHEAGDDAIRTMGQVLRKCIDIYVGRSNAKSWRVSGDEFMAFTNTYPEAVRLARAIRKALQEIPALGGTHQLAMDIGIGESGELAEQALISAKQRGKKDVASGKPATSNICSSVEGYEGAI